METHTNKGQSRRKFLGSSAALAAISLLPAGISSCSNKPAEASVAVAEPALSSKFGGVQIGTITYSWRDMPSGLENIIKYCKETGINSIELMSGDLESYMGAPENPMMAFFRRPPAPAPKPGGATPPPQRMGRPQLTAEQRAEIEKYNAFMKEWRTSLPMSKVEAARKLLDDEGIQAHIVKFSPSRWSDEEIDYAFKVAKAMGAKAVTEEIGLEAAAKLGPFAEKHGMYVAMHNHMQYAEEGFDVDAILAASPAVMLNFDAGHFFGSTGIHPNEMIRKYHDRIYSVHMKDKTGPKAETPNANQVWGQGEMPIEDVLLLIKQEKWPIYCDIELEYDIKPWSNSVKEVRNCVHYARQILI